MLCFILCYCQLHPALLQNIHLQIGHLSYLQKLGVCLFVCVHLTDNDQQCSYERQKSDVERAAQSDTGDDEGDDEDEEADDHQCSHCLGPSWSQTQTSIQIRLK